LKYGCPTLILPHVIDQFAWNALVYDLGAGPKGIAISKLSRNSLDTLLSDLWQNSIYKQKALRLSQKMQAPANELEIYHTL
jgi:UDP:flavonoid glycosyltransferase YjiC (YdhE family)